MSSANQSPSSKGTSSSANASAKSSDTTQYDAAAYYAAYGYYDPSQYANMDPNAYAAYYAQYYNAASASAAGVSSAAVPGMNGSMPMIPPHMQMPHIHNPKKRKAMRTAAGEVWEDPLLAEWDPNDFRLFCGDLGNDVTDEILTQAFSKYPSFQKARVVRDKRSSKSKGYGFVSFKTADDYTRAFKDMNGKYVGARPVKLRKSTWKDRSIDTKGKKQKK